MVKVKIPYQVRTPQDADYEEVGHEEADDIQVINAEVLIVRSDEAGTVAVYADKQWISATVTRN